MSIQPDSKREDLVTMLLYEKIEYSKKIIKEALERFDNGRLAIAWTGGKDSTTMLWLYKKVCREPNIKMPRCMFIDEGDVSEEILEHVNRVKKEWDVEVVMVKNTDVSDKAKNRGDMIKVSKLNGRNRQELLKIGFDEDEFPFEPESYVGNHLMKTVAMNLFFRRERNSGSFYSNKMG